MKLADALPFLLPRAIAWAEAEARRAAREGEPLACEGLALASRAGVGETARIRILVVDELPRPDDPALSDAVREAGFFPPETIGLTLGHAVFLRGGHVSRRALSHELRHVAQYEKAGGIAGFLPVYVRQVLEFGYAAAPLEEDARRHEADGFADSSGAALPGLFHQSNQ